MKKALTTIIMLAAIVAIFGQATGLFFSEYLEGSSNNKALEIYNGTGVQVDLSAYTVKLGSNGGEWSTTNIITLTGTLDNGQCYVIANAGANATILGIADVTSTVTYYNGDDAVGLFNGTTLIDIIGVYQSDPGTAWAVAGTDGATLNHTLIRKPNVIQGNLDFISGASTNADDSEWLVFEQDYINDLGIHTFDPNATDPAATPTFNPPAGVYTSALSVSIACSTPGSQIRYTTNGSEPNATSTLYSNPLAVSTTTTLKAKAFVTGMDPSYTATATYSFATVVGSLSELRQMPADNTVYYLPNPVILAYKQSNRNQKYVQDDGAGILIDDTAGVITTNYNIGDAITGLSGRLTQFFETLQFNPVSNPGPATSTGNNLVIPIVTIADLNSDIGIYAYQSRVVYLNDVHFDNPTGNYTVNPSINLGLSDDSGSMTFRTTFWDADYVGTPVHTGTFNLQGIIAHYQSTVQITPRMLADFNAAPPSDIEDDVVTPAGAALIGNYPNPFNPNTNISFTLDKAAPADVIIYNQKGQIVKTFNVAHAPQGVTTLSWNGTDDSGKSVTSGVYFFRLKTGSFSSTKKMVLMK